MLSLAALLLSAQPEPSAAPSADAGPAIWAFADICLAHPDSAEKARRAAEEFGFVKGPTFANRGGPAPMEAFAKPPLELYIREQRNGVFGCIVGVFLEPSLDNAAVADAVTALPGLVLKSSKGGARNLRAIWMAGDAPQGSKVYLNIGYLRRGNLLLSLESKAKK